MNFKSIAKILVGSVATSVLGFICLLFVTHFYDKGVLADYIRLINYSLILLPIVDLGRGTYIASSEILCKKNLNYLKFFSIIGALIICIFDIKIASYVIVLAIIRYLSARQQRRNRWIAFGTINIIPNLVRILVIVGLLIYDGPMSLTETIIIASLVATVCLVFFDKADQPLQSERDRVDFQTILPHTLIGIIIGIAMRLDLVIVDWFFSEELYVEYGVVFQLILIIPLITNALINYAMVNNIPKQTMISPVKVVAGFIVISPLVFFLIDVITKILFFELGNVVVITSGLVLFGALGGVYYSKLEGAMYKSQPQRLLINKFIQLGIIAIPLPFYFFGLLNSIIYVGGFVFLSRLYMWFVIYAENNKSFT